MKNIIATTECQKHGLDFAEVFKWQYLASKSANIDIPMDVLGFGDWSIYVGKGLAVARLADKSGNNIGFLLGIGVDETKLVSGTHRVDTDAASDHFFDDIERWIHILAGRHTVFISNARSSRVYSDAIGMNGCVYNKTTRAVASSVLLCLDRPVKPHPQYADNHVQDGGKYSLFHTPDPDVQRGNPSHYLDLDSFDEIRFWPKDTAFNAAPKDLTGIYDTIQARTKFVIEAICDQNQVAFPVSGGQDSRLMLALAGTGIQKVDYLFSHIHNYASRIDATIAGELARRLQIPLHVLDRRHKRKRPPEETINAALAAFNVACGYSASPPREMVLGLTHSLPADHVVLRGHLTDILRAVFTNRSGPEARAQYKWQLKRMLIVKGAKFNEAHYQAFLPDYKAWIDTLPAQARLHQIDLMFMEIYYSSTVGCSFPAWQHGFFMSPFNSRALVEQCLRIPEDYRRKSAAVFDCIHRFNPSLSDVPHDFEFGGKRELKQILDLAEMQDATRARQNATMHRYQTFLGHDKYSWTDLE